MNRGNQPTYQRIRTTPSVFGELTAVIQDLEGSRKLIDAYEKELGNQSGSAAIDDITAVKAEAEGEDVDKSAAEAVNLQNVCDHGLIATVRLLF